MKSIKILKKIYKNNPDIRVQRNNLDVNFTIHDFSNIKKAIKELEELENRDCSTCSKNSYLDCPCWTYSDGKITDIKYCSEWKKKVKITNI